MTLAIQFQHMLAAETVKVVRPPAAYLCIGCDGWFTADWKRLLRPPGEADVALRYCPECRAKKGVA